MERVGKLREWLAPTLVGSVVGFWVAVTLYCLEWEGLAEWPRAMVKGTGLGLLLAASSLLADVWLLRKRWRRLPLGRAAWWMALGAPLVAQFLYILPPWELDVLPGLLVLTAKMLLTAFTLRLVFGRLPTADA